MSLKSDLKDLRIKAWTLQLYEEFNHLQHDYSLELRRPTFQIVESASFWGQWDPLLRTIRLNIELIKSYRWDTVLEVLKHEIAHQIVNEKFGVNSHIHDEHFKKACDLIAVAYWARRATGDLHQAPSPEVHDEPQGQEAHLLRKFEKLMALAQSDNQNEAQIALQAASLLKSKYKLNTGAVIRPDSYCYATVCHQKKIVPYYQTRLAGLLVEFFDVEVVFTSLYDASQACHWKAFEILGTRKNVKIAEYFYHFIWDQLPKLWQQHKSTGGQGSNRRSYYLGVMSGLGDKMMLERRSHLETLSQRGLMKTRKQELAFLHSYLKNRHPRIEQRVQKGRFADEKGFQEGKKRGSLLDFRLGLNQGKVEHTPLLS